jgi:hypothetical protein
MNNSNGATSSSMVAALERHYRGAPGSNDADAYATYTELTKNSTGQRCDFLVVSLWESRGLAIDGHEIKVSRTDWLKELATPAKADTWWSVCHRWWLVVPDASLIHDGELPDGWGLMVPVVGRRRMKVLSKPTVLRVDPPMWLLTALVKRDQREVALGRRQCWDDGYQAGLMAERERADKTVLTPEQTRRLRVLDELETAVGGPIDAWGPNRISVDAAGLALRVARALQDMGPRRSDIGLDRLIGLAKAVGEAGEKLRDAHAEVIEALAPDSSRSVGK